MKKKSLSFSHQHLNCMTFLSRCVPDAATNICRLGVGASLPPGQEAHSSPGIAKSSYLENKLRAQLLGKKASSTSRRNGAVSSHGPIKASTKCKSRDAKASSESEDEMGRTALWSKVVRSTTEIPDREELQPSAKAKVDVIPSNAEEMILRATSSKKRSSSYLDEVLMARSAKRKKKRNIRPND